MQNRNRVLSVTSQGSVRAKSRKMLWWLIYMMPMVRKVIR